MSYYHIKNLKTVKTENGYNAEGTLACSNITDWKDRLIWEKQIIYKNDFETKEQLEYALFKDFLDGNLHGACGKFSPLNWNNNKVNLPVKEREFLKRLDNKFWTQYRETKKYNTRLKDRYDKIRYSLYFRAWKQCLIDEKTVRYTLTFKGYNVTSLTKRSIKYTGYKPAKIFKGLPQNDSNLQMFLAQYPNDLKVNMQEVK